MSDTAYNTTNATTTDHDGGRDADLDIERGTEHDADHDTGYASMTATGSTATSTDRPDAVSSGDDGYEYHRATESDHELHGSDLHDSVLVGALGDDKLVGGIGDDILDGDTGNNSLDGGSGDDILIAGSASNRGHNHLHAGSGDDVLVAGGTKTHSLDDFLKANPVLSTAIASESRYASLSTLIKGATDDTGGGASNIFEVDSGSGHDLIFNFHVSSDKLLIHREINGSDILDDASLVRHIEVSGDDVRIELGNGNSVTLVGVDVEHLSASNIDWA
ncbi:MAG: hypothetical protein D4R84_09310 [Rhodocyclaceae bacterium]|nr:MAG: hypothetical protein D4R84_09310 [Rhodocyclaceae bacterium]